MKIPQKTTLFIIGILLLLVTTIATIATTPAYAQSRACPEGYTIQKGKCVGQPIQTETQVCPDKGPNNDRVDLIVINGQEYCTIGTVSSIIVNGQPACRNPSNEILNPDGNVSCFVIILMITETTTTCEVGTLNEETGMCELRPGNRR